MQAVQPYSCAGLHQRIYEKTTMATTPDFDPIADHVIERMDKLDDKSSRTINSLRDLFFTPGTTKADRKVVDFFYSLIYKLSNKIQVAN